MNVTLKFPETITLEIAQRSGEPVESAGVLLVSRSEGHDGVRLLAREVHWVPSDAYDVREADRLAIRSSGYVRALSRAADIHAVAVWFHTHPGGNPVNSEWDDAVDRELEPVFRLRTGQDFYASLVFSPSASGLMEFSGRLYHDGQQHEITQAASLGSRFRFIGSITNPTDEQIPTIYDRQIRAFGGEIQGLLRRLRVAIVGAGGTGSAVAEQLARLGVGDMLIVDPDDIEESNLTRVYGSSPEQVGEPKAIALEQHIKTIAPHIRVRGAVGKTTQRSVAEGLTDRDVIFGCSDDNAGRLVLSRLSSYYLIPVIDCGVLLSSVDGSLIGIDGRVTVMSPGYPCLNCRNRIDMSRAAAEQLNPAERLRLQDEGYAPELGRTEPAVVAYTTLVAGLAVAELLERLTGYGPTPAPSELIFRAHEREISTNSATPRGSHFCDPADGKIGHGDQDPFLGTTWSAS